MKTVSTLAVLLLFLVTSISSQAATQRKLPSGATLVKGLGGDQRIGVYVSPPWGFSTSSYWIEGPKGVIVFDVQFLPKFAEEMSKEIERITKKKIVQAVVLHPNPDKFNGTEVFQKRGARVITSDQVLSYIPSVHEDRYESFNERYSPDYPQKSAKPESFGSQTTEIEAGGLKIKLHVMGAGASEGHVVGEFDGHLFVGDLVANKNHSWLEIGKTDEWLKRLQEMKTLKPRFVHPGRGASGDGQLLNLEEKYLLKVIELVKAENPKKNRSKEEQEAAIERVAKKVRALYPNYGFDVFLDIGLPAEWERQAKGR